MGGIYFVVLYAIFDSYCKFRRNGFRGGMSISGVLVCGGVGWGEGNEPRVLFLRNFHIEGVFFLWLTYYTYVVCAGFERRENRIAIVKCLLNGRGRRDDVEATNEP